MITPASFDIKIKLLILYYLFDWIWLRKNSMSESKEEIRKQMEDAAKELNFLEAARLRDLIDIYKKSG